MKFLSLDPSINNVGWTTYNSKMPNQTKKPTAAWKWGKWELEGSNREMRLVDLRDRIRDEIGDFDHLVIEYPTFFSSAKGQIAAHKSYTIDLACICGYIAGCFDLDHRNWHQITATEWKGAVQKEITAKKFYRVFKIDPSAVSEHAIDSTMLLRYFLLTYGPKVFQAFGEGFPVSPLLKF